MKKLLFCLMIFSSGYLIAQDENDMNKHSVSLNLGGTSVMIGGSYEYFAKERFQFEVGAGYPGFGIGFNYYPWKRSPGSFRPFMGLSARMISNYLDYFHPMYVLPVGVTWFMKKRFNLALAAEPGLITVTAKSDPAKEILVPFIWGNFKLTYRIGK